MFPNGGNDYKLDCTQWENMKNLVSLKKYFVKLNL